MIDKFSSLLLAREKSLAALILILAVVSVMGATHIRFVDGARDIFASSYPEYTSFEKHKLDFPQTDTEIVIVAKSESAFDRSQVDLLRNLILDVQLIEGIEFAHSIFSVQKYDRQSGQFQNVIDDDLTSYPDIATPLAMAETAEWKILPLINSAHNETVIVFSVEEEWVDNQKVQPVIDELNAFVADVPETSGLTLNITGTLPILNLIVSRIIAEQALLNIAGALFGALMSLMLFRSLAIGLLNGVAPVLAVSLTLGAMGWFGLEMNVLTNSISILILVITMANCIHMTYELRKNAALTKDREVSIKAMMKAIAAPCVLTSLTTMIAMGSLIYSNSILIQMFSISAMVGLILSLFASIVVHPFVFAVAWRFKIIERALTRNIQPQQSWSRGFGKVTQWLVGKRYSCVLLSGLLAAILLSVFLPIQSTHRFNEYLYDDEPIILALKQAETISSPTQSLDIVIRRSNANTPLISDANLAALAKIHLALETAYPDNDIYSLHDLSRTLSDDNSVATATDMQVLLEQLPERIREELIGKRENAFKLSLRVNDQPSEETRHMLSAIHAQLDLSDVQGFVIEPVNGLTAMAAELSDRMIKELTISFLIAAFACPFLIGLWFLDWRYAVAAILPNVIPVLMVGAWLMATGWKLQFTGALALSIAFGVAVDDTVHVLNRLHINRRKIGAAFTISDLSGVMQHVAPALITTTLVLSVGISSVFFSQMPTVQYFGTMCMAIFLLALLADLFMLLPMVAVLEKGRSTPNHT